MRYPLILAAAMAVGFCVSASAAVPESKTEDAVDRVAWRTDLERAFRRAKADESLVLVYFHADWCAPCKTFEKAVFADEAFATYLERHFTPLRVDDTRSRGKVSKKYGRGVYPSLVVLRPDGDVVHGAWLLPPDPEAVRTMLDRVRKLPGLRKAVDDGAEPKARLALAETLLHLGSGAEAETHLRRLLETETNAAEAIRPKATFLLGVAAQDRPEVAVKRFREFLAKHPGHDLAPNATYRIGILQAGAGELDAATETLQGLIKRWPDSRWAFHAEKALEKIERAGKAPEAGDKSDK